MNAPYRDTAIVESRNIDLGKDRITDKVRVSSAAIYSSAYFGDYRQVETWIFSDDPRQKSHQIIHGTCSVQGDIPPALLEKCRHVHRRIVGNLTYDFFFKHKT
jgi:hypothetical protein